MRSIRATLASLPLLLLAGSAPASLESQLALQSSRLGVRLDAEIEASLGRRLGAPPRPAGTRGAQPPAAPAAWAVGAHRDGPDARGTAGVGPTVMTCRPRGPSLDCTVRAIRLRPVLGIPSFR